MRMNLYVLYDALSESGPLILASDSPEPDLEKTRYLPGKEERQNMEYMYIVTVQELVSAYYQTDKRLLTFLCQGNVDPLFLTNKGWSVVIILENANYNEVFDIVQSTLKAYCKWEEKSLETALSSCLFKVFLDIVSPVFRVPITLTNCIGQSVFSAGELSVSSLDSVWDSLRYKGIFSHDMLSPEEWRFLNSSLNNRHGPFTLQVPSRQRENIDVIVPLYDRNTLPCTVVFIGYNTLSKDRLSLMYYLQQHIESISNGFFDFESLNAASAHRIIDISSESKDPIELIMGPLPKRWNEKEQFLLLATPFEQKHYFEVFLNDAPSLSYTILTAPTAFTHNSKLIFVKSNTLNATARLLKIRKVLHNSGLVADISNCFHDVSFVRQTYHQCEMMLDLRPIPAGADELYFSQEQYCQYLCSIPSRNAISESPYNFSLLQLAQKKEKRLVATIHDLRIFLTAGGGFSRASGLLQIHKNTLKARLGKPSWLIDMKFPTLGGQEPISLYLTCLIIRGQSNQESIPGPRGVVAPYGPGMLSHIAYSRARGKICSSNKIIEMSNLNLFHVNLIAVKICFHQHPGPNGTLLCHSRHQSPVTLDDFYVFRCGQRHAAHPVKVHGGYVR